jgi:hypothetical protein
MNESNYWSLVGAAQILCALLDASPISDFFGGKAEESPISDILLAHYDLARSIIRRHEYTVPKEPTPMQTLMTPWTSMNPMMGAPPQQVLITQQVSAKEPTVIKDITLDELLRLVRRD